MKLLVVSDSHGKSEYLYTIVSENIDADFIIFLGDGERDLDCIETIPNLNARIVSVCGNCDPYSNLPITSIENIGGHRFYISHGFKQGVKLSRFPIVADAKQCSCDVVLYGHTHVRFYDVIDEVHVFNPGTASRGEYGIINVNGSSLEFKHCEI